MMQHSGKSIPVPMHQGKDVAVSTLRRIIKSAGVSVDEFLDALKEHAVRLDEASAIRQYFSRCSP